MNVFFDRLRTRSAAFLHDLVMIPAAWLLAYWLRFNLGAIPEEFVQGALFGLPVIVITQAIVFWFMGLYRGVWRFASLPDLIRIVKAVLFGTALSFGVLFAINRLEAVPRSLPVLYVILQLLLLAGPRLVYRWRQDRRLNLRSGQRVLIVGAGRVGEMLVRDILRDRNHAYVPTAFVDNKPRRQGSDVHGVPVVGAPEEIPELVQHFSIDIILLANPTVSSHQMRNIVELCERAQVPFRTVPQLQDVMSGQVSIDQLRAVSIEDLLGREPVELDWPAIHAGLTGRSILVTGAGGSIGAELCRQIARLRPSQLILVDNGEFNLYRIDRELRERHPQLALAAYLVDVTDSVAIGRVFERTQPQVVFHAAAYKHVPMLESQIREAVRNNVVGTRVVADAADRHGCAEFVFISTDKAVNPSNVLGATKRLAEIYCLGLGRHSTSRFVTVRFGNVLDSAGSVVPLFRAQIEAGGPVTVTHPEIERFFMTIPEACQLIMQAAVMGEGGEIFVLDMGQAVKIRYLAEQMIRLTGKTPGKDIAIDYIGLRPGEKLSEELFYAQEGLTETRHPKIRVARHWSGDWPVLRRQLDTLSRHAREYQEDALYTVLRQLVPDWGECVVDKEHMREATNIQKQGAGHV